MIVAELKAVLEGWDPTMEVVVRVNGEEIEDGEVMLIVDERSICVEYGKVTIIADQQEV